MLQIPDNVRRNVIKLVPSSIMSDIRCFRFFDNHPLDERKVDITVCTCSGELKEFYQRELVSSVFIESKATNIEALRNKKCELFYLVSGDDELIVLSRKSKLEVVHRLTNIERYEVDDLECTGQLRLQIFRKDDAVPLIFDDNCEYVDEHVTSICTSADDALPLVKQLMRKLTEARYTVQRNEKAYADLLRLRQQASYSACDVTAPLVLRSTKPCVKCCDGNIVIMLEVLQCKIPVQDVSILLHGTTRPSLLYTTKLYERTLQTPYWKEISQPINGDSSYAIVCVIRMKELKYNINNRVDFDGVISYKVDDKEHFISLQNVSISALDTMNKEFNILSDISEDNKLLILCTMATADTMELCLRHMKADCDTELNVLDIFCKHLQMERLESNLVVHRQPLHALNGVMIVLDKYEFRSCVYNIIVYTRCNSQILALVNYVYDVIPYRIIITTANQKIVPKHGSNLEYKEEISNKYSINFTEYGTSILNQTSSMLSYLDSCIIKMNQSKDPLLINKVGTEIFPFASGTEDFKEFRRQMLNEARRGIDSLKKSTERTNQDEGMIIDSD